MHFQAHFNSFFMSYWLDSFGQYWIKLKDHWKPQYVLLITVNVASRRESLRAVLALREESKDADNFDVGFEILWHDF